MGLLRLAALHVRQEWPQYRRYNQRSNKSLRNSVRHLGIPLLFLQLLLLSNLDINDRCDPDWVRRGGMVVEAGGTGLGTSAGVVRETWIPLG